MKKVKNNIVKPKGWMADQGPPTVPGHYMGMKTGNGFDFRDGKFFVSPGNATLFTELLARERAVNSLLEEVNKYAVGQMALIHERKTGWWGRLLADIGGSKHSATWNEYEGAIVLRPPEPKPEKPEKK